MRTPVLALVAVTLLLAGCGGGGSSGTATTAGPRVIDIRIEGGKPVGGIVRATVPKGKRVILVVQSDVDDEVHVHGYDVKAETIVGGSMTLAFRASIAGVFEAELEQRGIQILELTVR